MPNDAFNRLTVTGPECELERLRTTAARRVVEGGQEIVVPLSIGSFVPTPPELMLLPPDRAGFPDEVSWRAARDRQAARNEGRYGASDWHSWRTGNWGVRCDLYDHCCHGGFWRPVRGGVSCGFDTAWGPPDKFIDTLALFYPSLRFRLHCSEPGNGVNFRATWKNGGRDHGGDADERVSAVLAAAMALIARGEAAEYDSIMSACYMVGRRQPSLFGSVPGASSDSEREGDRDMLELVLSLLPQQLNPRLRSWRLGYTPAGELRPVSLSVEEAMRTAIGLKLLVPSQHSGSLRLGRRAAAPAELVAEFTSCLTALPAGEPNRRARYLAMFATADTLRCELGRPATQPEITATLLNDFRPPWADAARITSLCTVLGLGVIPDKQA